MAEEYRVKCEELEEKRLQDQIERDRLGQALILAETQAQKHIRDHTSDYTRTIERKDNQISELTQSLTQLRKEVSESRSALGSKSDSDAAFASYKKRTEVMSEWYVVSDLRRQVQTLEEQKEEMESRVGQLVQTVEEKQREVESWMGKCAEGGNSGEAGGKKRITQLERELKDAATKNARLEEECYELHQHLKQAANTEFSDPANLILTDQVHTLEARLQRFTEDADSERADFQAKIDSLEQQLENAKNQLRKQPKPAPVIKNPPEEPPKESLRDLEKRYVDTKMTLASVEMEREALIQKYKEAQERLRQYSQQYTELEVEFYKVNERFGQTINAQNDLELEIVRLRQQVNEKKRGK